MSAARIRVDWGQGFHPRVSWLDQSQHGPMLGHTEANDFPKLPMSHRPEAARPALRRQPTDPCSQKARAGASLAWYEEWVMYRASGGTYPKSHSRAVYYAPSHPSWRDHVQEIIPFLNLHSTDFHGRVLPQRPPIGDKRELSALQEIGDRPEGRQQ
ncbi:hypothetical protein BV25DRAFT_1899901 [Artomyces pyxidatus]|uniref:Uncharacterized protein n=1 Tax=Artomyces pyxidatus TaxID=48021 RepID=A0ACB8T355_9AGAM|nr:hypothetical protein BV25DRAFT_1899901 [Artomyces pyxidatus]